MTPRYAPPRLMIADDDPVFQSLLESSLGATFEVVGTVADTEAAIALARESQPDAALIDVEMPRGGGLRAVEGIRGVAPGTAIVMLSFDYADTHVRELIQAGAIAYHRKGGDLQQLAESLIDSIAVHENERR